MPGSQKEILQTQKWVQDVVVGCNFCPFASKEVKENKIRYQVETSIDAKICLDTLLAEMLLMDADANIETTLLIFSLGFSKFRDYLDLVEDAEDLLKGNGYEGTYQVASFHPLYRFAGTSDNDAANYTNRSIYPMLHIIREASIEEALLRYKSPEKIPDRNIDFARNKGTVYMKMLRDACM